MVVKRYTALDFDQNKESLKQFLKGQKEFQDFDFEGSGINLLLDLLAYNTMNNAFYGNMIANEMFLDTATIRNNVVSRAKALGYVPTSTRAPYATLNLQVTLPYSNLNPEYVIVPRHAEFMAKTTNTTKTVTCYTPARYIINKTLENGTITQYAGEIQIFEGVKLTHTFIVDEDVTPNQRFILPNANIDSSTLLVAVKDSATATFDRTWNLATDVNVVTEEDRVYFIQEADNQYLELYFGDGFIGRKLEQGNVITVTYFVTQGPLYHGLSKFQVPNLDSPGFGTISKQYITATTIEPLRAGSEVETTDSIKFRAPLYYDTQARAVTKRDYETLLLKDYPQIEFARVWGGEENIPPRYGVVFVSAKPRDAKLFNVIEKENIINTILKPRNIISMEVQFVDPEYMNIVIDTTIRYQARISDKTQGEIESAVRDAIDQYAQDSLTGFESEFRYSGLVKYIDQADSSIVSNNTTLQLKYDISPSFNASVKYTFSFQTKLSFGDVLHNKRSIRSAPFFYNGFETFIADDGLGTLFSFRNLGASRIIVHQFIGTVNYETGEIQLEPLNIQGLPNSRLVWSFYAIPESGDFFAIRNRLLTIDQNDVTVSVINENR